MLQLPDRPVLPSPIGVGSPRNMAAKATKNAERRCGSNGSQARITASSWLSERLIGRGWVAGMGKSSLGPR
jgi:hypothetical protein